MIDEDFKLYLLKLNLAAHIKNGYKVKFKLSLDEDLTTKARPRFDPRTGRAYHTTAYKKAQKNLIDKILAEKSQGNRGRYHNTTITTHSGECSYLQYIRGKFKNTKDSDNSEGFILDCLVSAKVIQSDFIKNVDVNLFFADYNISENPLTVFYILQKPLPNRGRVTNPSI